MGQLISVTIVIALLSAVAASFTGFINPMAIVSDRASYQFVEGFIGLRNGQSEFTKENGAPPEALEDFTPEFAFIPNSPFEGGYDAWEYKVLSDENGPYGLICLTGDSTEATIMASKTAGARLGNDYRELTACDLSAPVFTEGQAENIVMALRVPADPPPVKVAKAFATKGRSFIVDQEGRLIAFGDAAGDESNINNGQVVNALGTGSNGTNPNAILDVILQYTDESDHGQMTRFFYYFSSPESQGYQEFMAMSGDDQNALMAELMPYGQQAQDIMAAHGGEVDMSVQFHTAHPPVVIEGINGFEIKDIVGGITATYILMGDGTVLFSGKRENQSATSFTPINTEIPMVGSIFSTSRSAGFSTLTPDSLFIYLPSDGSSWMSGADYIGEGFTTAQYNKFSLSAESETFIGITQDRKVRVSGNARRTGYAFGEVEFFTNMLPDTYPVDVYIGYNTQAVISVYTESTGTYSLFQAVDSGADGVASGYADITPAGYTDPIPYGSESLITPHHVQRLESGKLVLQDVFTLGQEPYLYENLSSANGDPSVLSIVRDISTATGSHELLVASDGTLWGRGLNGNGQLGQGMPLTNELHFGRIDIVLGSEPENGAGVPLCCAL